MVGITISKDKVFDWIKDIPDPEIPVISIAELGMLRDVKFENGNYVVTITPTYTACPAMGFIEDEIKLKLAEHDVNNVKVNMTYDPAWTTDWLSEEAKEKLRKYGISPPQHSACKKVFGNVEVALCPRCNSQDTSLLSKFGSTACKALYKCNSCKETFEYFKCHA